MIQELADSIWTSPKFKQVAKAIERTWLCRELRIKNTTFVSDREAARAMSAAAILASSNDLAHRIGALRLGTYIFEVFDRSNFAFDSALRVILTRLKNFPAIETRKAISDAFPTLPFALAIEEVADSSEHTVEVAKQNRLLTAFQIELWRSLAAGNSVALSAPTSVGKSYVLELYLASLFERGDRTVAYVVPTRALISQVSKELSAIFMEAKLGPEIVTVPTRPDSQFERNAIYVMTQERLHITLQARADFRVDLLIVDEAQSISEGGRGILLQGVIDELLSRNSTTQVLFASPSTRNLDTFGRLFSRIDIRTNHSKEPTVSQNFLTIKRSHSGAVELTAIRESNRSTKIGEIPSRYPLRTRVEKLAHLPVLLCPEQPNLIYANGADEAEDVALAISKLFHSTNPSHRKTALANLAKETVHPEYILAECVLNGVGFHYANIPTNLRQAIEAAFSEGELKYLVCTSTLLQGVNLPAKNIFMFKPTRGQGKPLEPADFWNLAGRAGRLRREFQGNVFLIDYDHWQRQPVRAAKDIEISPTIENSIKLSTPALYSVIEGKGANISRSKRVELESAFVRLFTDLKEGTLADTLSRLTLEDRDRSDLTKLLEEAEAKVDLPAELLKRNHNVSIHKQQRLYDRIKEAVKLGEPVIPLAPRDAQSFNSYAAILKMCHEEILVIDTSRNLHRFHALLARKWMLGYSIPRIISEGLRRERKKGLIPDSRKFIRTTLEIIEEAIRFQTIRLFGCYKNLLEYALAENDSPAIIPDVELYLEIGASTQTMISLMSLGLSRAVAIKLDGFRGKDDPELNPEQALAWLASHAPDFVGFKLSNLQLTEVLALLEGRRSKGQ